MATQKHCISIDDFTKDELLALLASAEQFAADHRQPERLRGKVVGCLFFEASTRTRLSFESAAQHLGAGVIGFSDAQNTSVKKGESLEDTIKTISRYCDAIIMRHPENGSAARAAAVSRVPVINAGDGSNEHPTQTLLDLYSIKATQGGLNGHTVMLAGDLKHSRTMHSLTKALALFNTSFIFASAPSQAMPKDLLADLKKAKLSYELRHEIGSLSNVDILYMNRTQRERFSSEQEYEHVVGSLRLTLEHLTDIKSNLKVLDPLPRVDEIDEAVDDHPAAYYFDQVENGMYVRQALLAHLL